MKLNVKNIVLVLLVVMLGSFAMAGMLGGIRLNFGNWTGISAGPVDNVNVDKTFAAGEIRSIEVNTVSTDVNIITVEEDEIRVHMYGSASINAVPDLIAEKRGSLLDVDIEHRRGIQGPAQIRLKLDIYVPAAYAGNIKVGTVSGDMNIRNLNLAELTFNSVSGNLTSSAVTAEKAAVKTTSGKAELLSFTGDLEFRSVSGDLEVNYTDFSNDITIITTSGNAKLKLPDNSEFYLKVETVSGSINSDFPLTITTPITRNHLEGSSGSNEKRITAKTVSGNVSISR